MQMSSTRFKFKQQLTMPLSTPDINEAEFIEQNEKQSLEAAAQDDNDNNLYETSTEENKLPINDNKVDSQIESQTESQIIAPTKVQRKLLAQYTNNDRDVRKMQDAEFLDYSLFLVRQQDVHTNEKTRKDYDTAKNFRQLKGFKNYVKTIGIFLMFALIAALCVLLVFAIIYLFVFMKRDIIKTYIDFVMLKIALSFLVIFIIFVLLFFKMSATVKKIISLL